MTREDSGLEECPFVTDTAGRARLRVEANRAAMANHPATFRDLNSHGMSS